MDDQKQSRNINTELLYLYVKNHTGHILYYGLSFLLFFGAYIYFYGLPDKKTILLTGYALFALSAVFAVIQNRLFKAIMNDGEIREEDYIKTLLQVALNKLGYTLPWLLILYFPYQTLSENVHYLGYIFVLLAVIITISASTPFFPLFIADIAVPFGFAVVITIINAQLYNTAMIYGFSALLFLFLFLLGWKISQSAKELVANKSRLETALQQAEEANRAKSDFLAMMSHEIRTPLSGILGMIDFMKDTTLTNKQRESLATLKDCSETLMRLLNDVLDLSKIEAGKVEIEKLDFDLHCLINGTVKIISPKAQEKGLELTIASLPKVPQHISADPNRLQQVLINLLSNAIKFTEKGSITLTLTSHPTDKNMIIITISDTGIGISKEEQAKLFRKFSQTDASISRKYGGTGLGLSITKNLIELMGGTISIESKKGKGSSFTVEIPYQIPDKKISAAPRDYNQTNNYAVELNILLVEDNKTNQVIALRLLEKHDHNVTIADTGEKAFELVMHKSFDLVLMDMQMPGMDGIATTKRIRLQGPEYRTIPIIAVTANVYNDSLEKCLEAGMVDRVTKPISPADLYEKIAIYAPANKIRTVRKTSATIKNSEDSLEEIRENMGEEYYENFLRKTISEMNLLLEKINQSQKCGDAATIHLAAHDLKSISGTLGLNALYSETETLEEKAAQNELSGAVPLIKTINRMVFEETARLYSKSQNRAQ